VIPLRLKLSGFLSYRDPVELDFSSFDLACISGLNGAGKSSLLDALTWVLFGQARKRDDSLVNAQVLGKGAAAEVVFTFQYENETYRVQRRLPRGKPMSLEFSILQQAGKKSQEWKPLTEHTLKDTQTRIEQILRLDYDTFVNVSFFLQGKADQFAQQPPTRRKEILGNILGLEAWEVYRDRAAEQRKAVEREQEAVDVRLREIEVELAEEAERRARLLELENQLELLTNSRKAQEAALANVRQVRASLDSQRDLVRKLAEILDAERTSLSALQARLAGREAERLAFTGLIAHSAEVESAYQAWQSARQEVEKWEQVAQEFREQDERRQPFLREIEAERARLEEEQRRLEQDRLSLEDQQNSIKPLREDLKAAERLFAEAESRWAGRAVFELQRQAGREKQAGLRSENESLKTGMDELKARIDQLRKAAGAVCPLCGQALSPEHRAATLDQLRAEGKQMGDRWRANKAALEELDSQTKALEVQLASLASVEAERVARAESISQLRERLETLKRAQAEWKTGGARRLKNLTAILEDGKYAREVRKKLARLDKELAALGYDAAAHDAARRREVQARSAEADFRGLESARAALRPLEDEIANLKVQSEDLDITISRTQAEHQAAAEALAAVEAQAPDLDAFEQSLFDLQERENRLNQEVGGALQKVTVLDDLRKRAARLEVERSDLGLQIGRYKALERAFGKDGVPALLIEQALPEIEIKANEILGRLSEDSLHLRFETQTKYKDEKRKELRETLDIRVSDGAGERDYEMFSGGEAFRVDFAIRLALSEVLAQRKGARLQMLVIDEGFGSQDALGRQRLIQAINAVRGDFAKILVITHLDELKDAFPTRIEVEKTEGGSTIRVI